MKMKEHGGAYAALKALGDDVMAQIDAKLTAGESGGAVAKWLQEEMKLLTDDKRASLTRKLERYRGTELRNKVISRITRRRPARPSRRWRSASTPWMSWRRWCASSASASTRC